jgi:hypothetical protein
MPLPGTRSFLSSPAQSFFALRRDRLHRGMVRGRTAAPPGSSFRLPPKRGLSSARSAFSLQSVFRRPGRSRRYVRFAGTALGQVPFSLFSRPIRRKACLGCPQLHASTACFRQANRNRLLRRSRSVLSLAHVMKLLTHKLSRLCRRRFSLFFIAFCSFDCFLFRHNRYPLWCGRACQFEPIPAAYSGQVGRFLYGCKVCLYGQNFRPSPDGPSGSDPWQ